MTSHFLESLRDLWGMFLELSPFLLLGLFLAGLLHIFVSKKQMRLVVGDEGMKGVFIAMLLGTPFPLCSCGVAPVAGELKRKGAAAPATMAFLITTPEVGVDVVSLTYGLMGPIMAIARPIAAYFLGMFGGFFTIGLYRGDLSSDSKHPTKEKHGESHHVGLNRDPDYVGFKTFYRSAGESHRRFWFRITHSRFLYKWYRAETPESSRMPPYRKDVLPLNEIGRRGFGYSFGELADEILPRLLIAFVISFLIFLFLPSDLSQYEIGKGIFPYLFMILLGMPLYVCASASAPIAAALIYKGLSPGAALVFLLAGPAVNITTMAMVKRYFGIKFLNIYVGTVVIGGLIAGITLDLILSATGWNVMGKVALQSQGIVGIIQWISAVLVIILIIYRFIWGDLRESFKELFTDIKEILAKINGIPPSSKWKENFSRRSRFIRYGVPFLILAYLATGIVIVPIGGVAYVRVFGHVAWKEWKPGLHYIPPYPIAHLDIWFPMYPREVVIGIKPGLENNALPTFFTGDENMMELGLSIQYVVKDPYRYWYQIQNPKAHVADWLQFSVNSIALREGLANMLSYGRDDFQARLCREFESLMDLSRNQGGFDGLGIDIVAINVVELTPPEEAKVAFRDVVSALEEREQSIIDSLKIFIEKVLKTRGEAVVEVERAKALAFSEKAKAKGRAQNILDVANAVEKNRGLLENLLWLETSERALHDRELYLLPPGYPPQAFKLWKAKEQNE